jgi:hypothetical protein
MHIADDMGDLEDVDDENAEDGKIPPADMNGEDQEEGKTEKTAATGKQ